MIRTLLLTTLLGVAALAVHSPVSAVTVQQDQNPPTVWCDYHHTSFFKSGVEFPGGVCYDVYTHNYYDASCKCTRQHKMTMRCPRQGG